MRLREVLKTVPRDKFGFTQTFQWRYLEMLTGSTGDVTIKDIGQETD